MTAFNTPGLDILTSMLRKLYPIEVPASKLLSLPREIRDDIVAYLLRAGDLAILRTSRQLYQESRERLFREGIFRFKLGFPDDDYPSILLPNEWILFQSLHFHIFVGRPDIEIKWLTSYRQLDDLQILDLTDLKVIYPKLECRIVFDFGTTDLEPGANLDTRKMRFVLALLEPLAAFTTVVVMFVPGQSGLWQNERRTDGKWEIVKGKLEQKFGPGKIIRGTDEEEERMVFHPLEFCNGLAQAKRLRSISWGRYGTFGWHC